MIAKFIALLAKPKIRLLEVEMDPIVVNISVNDSEFAKYVDMIYVNVLFSCAHCAYTVQSVSDLTQHFITSPCKPSSCSDTQSVIKKLLLHLNGSSQHENISISSECYTSTYLQNNGCNDAPKNPNCQLTIETKIPNSHEKDKDKNEDILSDDNDGSNQSPASSPETENQVYEKTLNTSERKVDVMETLNAIDQDGVEVKTPKEHPNSKEYESHEHVDCFINDYVAFLKGRVEELFSSESLQHNKKNTEKSSIVFPSDEGFDYSCNLNLAQCVVGLTNNKSKFKCSLCPDTPLVSSVEYELHKKCHTVLGNLHGFSCVSCTNSSGTLHTWSKVHEHLAIHHKVKFELPCSCDKYLPSHSALLIHKDTFHRKMCSVDREHCSYWTYYCDDLTLHERSHNAGTESRFMCPECGQEPSVNGGYLQLVYHIEKQHAAVLPVRYTCPGCDAPFCLETSYKEHYVTCASVPRLWHSCLACGQDVPVAAMREHLEQDRNTPEALSVLKKASHLLQTLPMDKVYEVLCRGSKTTGDDGTNYKCALCYKRLNTSKRLVRHMRRVHPTGARQSAVCASCGRVFLNSSQCRDHVRQVHEGKKRKPSAKKTEARVKKQHTCTQCDYTTPHRYRLHNHTLSAHQGVYRYHCQHCSYRTNEPSDLRRHNRKHLSGEAAKAHACTRCDFRCVYRWALVDHMRRKHVTRLSKVRRG